MLVLSPSLMVADHQHGAAIQLRVKDTATGSDTIYFGFGYPFPMTMRPFTYCSDPDTIDLYQYGISVQELMLPPKPPDGIFDVRFIDSRSGAGLCLDQGILNSFHVSSLTPKNDTFKILVLGSLSAGDGFPITFSWTIPTSLNLFFNSLRLKYTDRDDVPQTIDMLTTSEFELPNPDANKVTIIANTYFSVEDVKDINNNIPKSFVLDQNYPNPFNPSTTIHYTIPNVGTPPQRGLAVSVQLKIYNLLGQEVATLVDGMQEAGYKSIEWNPNNVPSGLYIYRLTTSTGFSSTKKMLLIR